MCTTNKTLGKETTYYVMKCISIVVCILYYYLACIVLFSVVIACKEDL